ncbi:MAG: dienelactone hydrolase family protein [Janthinobacterium lividum]
MTYPSNLTAVLDLEGPSAAGTTSNDLDYDVDGVRCRGYLSRPDDDQTHPGVLVLHEWTGIGDYVRMRADMLARLGYIALAADLYGADVRPTPQEAPAIAGRYYDDQPLLRSRLVGSFETLLAQPGVDPQATAAIGYCFGGAAALQLARTGIDVGGVVSFHGTLQTGPAGEAAGIRAKLLVLHGAADPMVPDADITALQDELRAARTLDWQLTAYSGAMHAFTMPHVDAPEHGAQFNPIVERRSWQAMKSFLTEVFSDVSSRHPSPS